MLIIVIVLLLLLAILGAAYISTTRSARVASAQNALSSDADDMISGISKICEGVIVDDLNDPFSNLSGNSASSSNLAVNRGLYQGQGQGKANTPNIAPTNYPIGVDATYNIGDIANTTDYPNLFFFYYNNAVSPAPGSTFTVSTPSNYITPVSPGVNGTPGNGWNLLSGHFPFTAVGTDPWLMNRVPVPYGAGNVPSWTSITQSIQVVAGGLQPASILGTPFEDPTAGPITTWNNPYLVGPVTPIYIGMPLGAPTPTYYVPGLYDGKTNYVAGDADGDGVADCLLFRVPGASYDGLTWYAGVRIIDNNSAINANTAWSQTAAALPFIAGGTGDVWNLFQTSVGLSELLNPGGATADNINSVNNYRFNGNVPAAAVFDETAVNGYSPPATPVPTRSDYGFISQSEALYQQFIRRIANPGYVSNATRYQPLPLSDEAALAYHFCLVNPESTITQVPSSVLEFLLPNSLWKTTSGTSPYYCSTAYGSNPSSDVATWFEDNFDYANPGKSTYGFQSLRPLLVTRNPVSNYIQQVYNNGPIASGGAGPTSSDPILPNYMLPYGPNTNTGATDPHFRGIWSSTPTNPSTGNSDPYNVNDVVEYPGPIVLGGGINTGPNYTFILVNAAGAGNAPATFNANRVLTAVTAGWQLQPWPSNPVKANINTATFAELFRAFWCVMAGNPSYATPFGVTGTDNYQIYDPNAPTAAAPTVGNAQLMFRSPLRDPTGAVGSANVSLLDAAPTGSQVTNTNVMLLRAALAAVNTLGLRDNSQNVISRTITLTNNSQIDTGAAPAPQNPVELQVYSSAPQPVISEVYANTFTGPDAQTTNSNPQGYVAVELYNPYSVPMTLKNWQLGLIARSASGSNYPNLNLQTFPTGTPPPLGAVSVIGPMQALNNPLYDAANKAYDYPPPAVGSNVIYIQPHGYALLENYNGIAKPPQTADDATCRPVSAVNPPPPSGVTGPSFRLTAGTAVQTGIWYGPGGSGAPTVCDVYVPNLQLVIQGTAGLTTTGASITANSTGGELVVLRPRRIDGTYSQSSDPFNTFNEGTTDASLNVTAVYLWDLVPVDSYDFTGLVETNASPYVAWSYVRQKGSAGSTLFKQFFPGFYSAVDTPREGAGTGTIAVPITGTIAVPITVAAQTPAWPSNATTNSAPSFGSDDTQGSYSNPFPPIQIANVAAGNGADDPMHFPNSVVSSLSPYPNGITPATTNLFPLGGFARNGDMLDVPFIGSYRIRITGGTLDQVSTASTHYSCFLELNSLPKDCSLAAVETGTTNGDAAQNVGRFVPMAASSIYATALQATPPAPPAGLSFPLPDYYSWARNLFNYLTVQSPSDAYLPNFDPNLASSNYSGTQTFAYPPQNNASTPVPPTPTLTANATAPDQTLQDNVGVEGLININTASWKALSALPFVSSATDANYVKDNQTIAQAIVLYRDGNSTTPGHGPFTSIFDLNQVTGFQTAAGTITISAGGCTASSKNGLLSPADPSFGTATALSGTNPVGGADDYQSDCLTLTRISNLVTTRSDTFTIYIELQGWQNVGVTNSAKQSIAQPMVTRRYAFIVDRSAINGDPGSRFLKTLTVPNN